MPERFKPFPQIARFPSEGDIPAEARSEGALADTGSSLLLNIPELAATANTVVSYASANSEGRRKTTERYAADFVLDPGKFTATTDALAMLEESKGYPAATGLRTDIARSLDRVRPQGVPSPEVAQQWLTLLVESPLYSPVAEIVLTRFIERCKTTKDMADFMYQLALGGFSSSNPEVVQRTMEIIGFQTPILTPDSPQAILHTLSIFDTDDTTLKKAMEVDGAFYYLASRRNPELLIKLDAAQTVVVEQPEYLEAHEAIIKANPDRHDLIAQHYQRPTSADHVLEYESDKDSIAFPLNLTIQNIGPLRKLLNDMLAQDIQQARGEGFTIALELPDSMGVRYTDTLSELGQIVRDDINKNRPEVVHMETPAHLRTLACLVPPEMDGRTEWNDIADANQRLRRNMIEDSRYLLSPRGDQIEITDPMLHALGFNSITYSMSQNNRRETVVTIAAGKLCEYRALLDEYFALRDVNTHNSIQLPQHGAFLENIILSHLREIRCSERVNEVGNAGTGTPGETRRAFSSRRAHRRILPEGQSPTTQQITRILGEYDIDLVRFNREREAAGDARRVTYVYEVENVSIAGVGPVRSRIPEATRQLQELLHQQKL